MKTETIRVRDPFVVAANGIYYLYNSKLPRVPNTVEVYRSRDLKNWDDPTTVYTLDTASWKAEQLWAPEVHLYRGKYYLFLSILGKNGLRGTEISVSDSPDDPFLPIADRPATPLDQSAIDGTLFLEGDTPYIVYSRDWPHCFDASCDAYVGEIWGQELSKDLTTPVQDAFCMFRSNQVPLSAAAPARHEWEGKPVVRYGSDAPFLMRLPSGKLYLTWSPIPDCNYVVLGAVADTLRGPWTHASVPVFDDNGGHAMFFYDLEGKLRMCLHAPEHQPLERARFFDVTVKDTEIAVSPSV